MFVLFLTGDFKKADAHCAMGIYPVAKIRGAQGLGDQVPSYWGEHKTQVYRRLHQQSGVQRGQLSHGGRTWTGLWWVSGMTSLVFRV